MSYAQSQKLYSKISRRHGCHYQNSVMINSVLANQLLNEKRSKPCTPLSEHTPKQWSDVSGLLLQRCIELKTLCDEVLEGHYDLYLFGSQVNGVSRSGSPDLDIWCVHTNGTYEQRKKIVQSCNFKLDFAFIKDINPHTRSIKLFE